MSTENAMDRTHFYIDGGWVAPLSNETIAKRHSATPTSRPCAGNVQRAWPKKPHANANTNPTTLADSGVIPSGTAVETTAMFKTVAVVPMIVKTPRSRAKLFKDQPARGCARRPGCSRCRCTP